VQQVTGIAPAKYRRLRETAYPLPVAAAGNTGESPADTAANVAHESSAARRWQTDGTTNWAGDRHRTTGPSVLGNPEPDDFYDDTEA
jgi:hypothetical protein